MSRDEHLSTHRRSLEWWICRRSLRKERTCTPCRAFYPPPWPLQLTVAEFGRRHSRGTHDLMTSPVSAVRRSHTLQPCKTAATVRQITWNNFWENVLDRDLPITYTQTIHAMRPEKNDRTVKKSIFQQIPRDWKHGYNPKFNGSIYWRQIITILVISHSCGGHLGFFKRNQAKFCTPSEIHHRTPSPVLSSLQSRKNFLHVPSPTSFPVYVSGGHVRNTQSVSQDVLHTIRYDTR